MVRLLVARWSARMPTLSVWWASRCGSACVASGDTPGPRRSTQRAYGTPPPGHPRARPPARRERGGDIEAGVSPSSPEVSRVVSECGRVLAGNRQEGVSGWESKGYSFTCPSPTTYPFQWWWDSAFIAIALLHVDPELAKQEVRWLLQGVQPDGFMPHMLLWEKSAHERALAEYSIRLAHPFYTATIQPPVIGRTVERIWDATHDVVFAREVLRPLLRHFDWLDEVRDPDRDGLIAIIQPDESGVDASPKFDPLMGYPKDNDDLVRWIDRLYARYQPLRFNDRAILALDLFQVEEALTNVCYVLGMQALARLCAGDEAVEFG